MCQGNTVCVVFENLGVCNIIGNLEKDRFSIEVAIPPILATHIRQGKVDVNRYH